MSSIIFHIDVNSAYFKLDCGGKIEKRVRD